MYICRCYTPFRLYVSDGLFAASVSGCAQCHRMSEGHQRAMQLFIQRPGKFMDEFSREFEEEFMKLMRTRCNSLELMLLASLTVVVFTWSHSLTGQTTAWWTTGPLQGMQEVIQTYSCTEKQTAGAIFVLFLHRYCRTRVLANSVYNNVVCDRHHIHMNSTIWVTLSEFVQVIVFLPSYV